MILSFHFLPQRHAAPLAPGWVVSVRDLQHKAVLGACGQRLRRQPPAASACGEGARPVFFGTRTPPKNGGFGVPGVPGKSRRKWGTLKKNIPKCCCKWLCLEPIIWAVLQKRPVPRCCQAAPVNCRQRRLSDVPVTHNLSLRDHHSGNTLVKVSEPVTNGKSIASWPKGLQSLHVVPNGVHKIPKTGRNDACVLGTAE